MACPVIGEKSIIHRLRSLTMSDISPRRKMAGRVLLGAAVLALPLTASISYAESMTTPNAPPAPMIAPAPPSASGIVPTAPPAPPALPFALQSAPEAPEAPEGAHDKNIERHVVVINRDDKDHAEGTHKVVHKHRIVTRNGEVLTAEEREEIIKEVREELADVDVEIREAMEEVRVSMIEMDKEGMKTTVKTTCKNGKSGETVNSDGKRTVHICTSEVMASALLGLKEARKALAESGELPSDMRAEVLKSLDEKIANWGSEG
jgi:hypothetical protein